MFQPYATPASASAVFAGHCLHRRERVLYRGDWLAVTGWTRRLPAGFKISAMIGYDLVVRYWHQGLMTEAITAVLRFGFDQMALNRVEATVHTTNAAWVALLSRMGFTCESPDSVSSLHLIDRPTGPRVLRSVGPWLSPWPHRGSLAAAPG